MFADIHAEHELLTQNFTMRRIHVVRIGAKFPEVGISGELKSLRSAKAFDPSSISEYVAYLKTNLLYVCMTLIKGHLERFDLKVTCHTLSESIICLCSKVLI